MYEDILGHQILHSHKKTTSVIIKVVPGILLSLNLHLTKTVIDSILHKRQAKGKNYQRALVLVKR